jgi:hypothetical protein
MALFRKKPVVIEAKRFDSHIQGMLISEWVGSSGSYWDNEGPHLEIHTPEGVMNAGMGDWIIKGVNGEFYPCKDEIFQKTYDPVVEPAWPTTR